MSEKRPTDLESCYKSLGGRLKAKGMATPDLDARLIIKAAAGLSDADFISRRDREISAETLASIESMAERRLAREPVSRILGKREFWGLPFTVTPAVLDPRPDSETLVDAALKHFERSAPSRILDLGTGSGCLIISLLHEWGEARGVAVDISEEALAIAERNAADNRVAERLSFRRGNWLDGFESNAQFDLVISNPPYIPRADLANLDADVLHYDPILALEGGIDGLDSYKSIFLNLHKHIEKAGIALFEIGIGQHDDVVRLAEKYGFHARGIHADLGGIPRVVEIGRGDK